MAPGARPKDIGSNPTSHNDIEEQPAPVERYRPTSNCRRKPIAIYEGPARDCPVELMVTVPLVQPGSLKEGWDDPKKSKICQVPAKSAVEKIASASTGKAKSMQITKIHN
jgi:hypothetical protein